MSTYLSHRYLSCRGFFRYTAAADVILHLISEFLLQLGNIVHSRLRIDLRQSITLINSRKYNACQSAVIARNDLHPLLLIYTYV